MPGIVQGTEYTIMNKTGLFLVPVRLNLEKKIGQKKKGKQTYNYKLWYLLQGK